MKFKDMPYERVNFDEVEKELISLTERLTKAKKKEELLEIHQRYYKLYDQFETTMTIASIRQNIDTSDEFYTKEQEYYDEVYPRFNNLIVAYQKELYYSPFRPYLEEKIGSVAFRNIELSMKANDKKLIPLMQEDNALVTKYNQLIAGAKIEWGTETLNLSLLKPYLTDVDREVRRLAHKKNSGFFSSVSGQLDEIFDKLVKVRTEQAKMMGYDNYIELGYYRMNRNSYDRQMVENYRNQIKEFLVPFTEKLHERRRKRLGLDRLSHIDRGVFFIQGNPKPEGSPAEIMEAARKMYHELSPETKEFFDYMMENELFDVLGRKTKKAGGYLSTLPEYQAFFVFANFNGTSGDVDVMTHECGHAFQAYTAMKNPIREQHEITMETAEIHSMGMEFFTEPWMELFFGDRAKDYAEMHLEDAASFIPYGCMVDEFQHIVYEHPEMTPAQRNQAWRDLERIYMPHLDYEDDQYLGGGGYWQRQPHIYNSPFYYIDYCLAQTCAMQYKTKIDEDYKKAWESYLKLCNLSAKKFFTQMLDDVGLVSPFQDGCIRKMIRNLENEIK